MTPYQAEQLQVLRRIAVRGLHRAQDERASRFVDLFQHLLDEIARLELGPQETQWKLSFPSPPPPLRMQKYP